MSARCDRGGDRSILSAAVGDMIEQLLEESKPPIVLVVISSGFHIEPLEVSVRKLHRI